MLLLGLREGKGRAIQKGLIWGSGATRLWSKVLFALTLHPALQDQDGGHPIDGLAPLFDREVGFAKEAVSFGGGEALVPEMDGKFEVFAEILGKRLNLSGLDAFSPGHAERQADDDFFHVVVANDAMKKREIVFLVLAMQRIQALGSDSERIGDGYADAACSDIEAEDASGGFLHHGDYMRLEVGPLPLGPRPQTRPRPQALDFPVPSGSSPCSSGLRPST